jgi:Transposase DDE domain/Domain of unknown function (DUF4372)
MAHDNTVLAQVLKLIPRSPIEALDKGHGTGRPSRVLSRWSQFGDLGFAPLAGRHSRRDVVYSRASQAHALAPIGRRPPRRSTLAEAKARQPMALYQALFATLYARCRAVAPKHRFRFKNPLFSLDSTTISLCLSRFPWAIFHTTQGAIKVHTLLDHASHLPAFVVVPEGKRSDLAVARGLHLPVGSIVAMDRGDIDYQFLFHLHQEGLYFVTRQKVKAQVDVTARFAIDRSTGVTADHAMVLSGPKGQAYPARLRQVRYRDATTGKRYVFWTNAFHLAAPTIPALSQQRWQGELFFKAIKQNLRSKTFLGSAENAVLTQVWVGLITYLILAFLRFKAGLGISFQQMVRFLQIYLFERRNLMDLCSPPSSDLVRSRLLCAV